MDENWSLFMGYYEDAINKNFLVRPAKANKDKPPWFNNATIKSSRRKKFGK